MKNLLSILGLFGALLDSGALIPGVALCLGLYIGYILLSARNVVPMTKDEIDSLWKFHMQTKCCKAKTCHEITKKKKVIVYECEFGFKQIQNKPLINVG